MVFVRNQNGTWVTWLLVIKWRGFLRKLFCLFIACSRWIFTIQHQKHLLRTGELFHCCDWLVLRFDTNEPTHCENVRVALTLEWSFRSASTYCALFVQADPNDWAWMASASGQGIFNDVSIEPVLKWNGDCVFERRRQRINQKTTAPRQWKKSIIYYVEAINGFSLSQFVSEYFCWRVLLNKFISHSSHRWILMNFYNASIELYEFFSKRNLRFCQRIRKAHFYTKCQNGERSIVRAGNTIPLYLFHFPNHFKSAIIVLHGNTISLCIFNAIK